jgi:hypothetical protein
MECQNDELVIAVLGSGSSADDKKLAAPMCNYLPLWRSWLAH